MDIGGDWTSRMADRVPKEAHPAPERGDRKPREIDIRDLLGDSPEITILHEGERYRLRVTANNKLILTK